MVEFNGVEETVHSSYKGRIFLNLLTAELQISDLRLEDSGNYEYEIYMNRNLFRKSYDLEVLGKEAASFLSLFLIHILNIDLLQWKVTFESKVKVDQVK